MCGKACRWRGLGLKWEFPHLFLDFIVETDWILSVVLDGIYKERVWGERRDEMAIIWVEVS